MKIISVRIGPMPSNALLTGKVDLAIEMPKITATFEDGSTKDLFEFYPDEISFTPEEFIGLTEEDAHHLKFLKDKEYLQS